MNEKKNHSPHVTHSFDLQLNNAVKAAKEAQHAAKEAAKTAKDTAKEAFDSSSADTKLLLKNLDAANKACSDLNSWSNLCSIANLKVKNAASVAGLAVKNSTDSNTAIVAAAKAIDLAVDATAQLAADLGAMYAQLNSAEIRNLLDEQQYKRVADATRDAATASEEAISTILDVAIAGAQTKTAGLLASVQQAGADIDALAQAITTVTKSAQATALAAYTDYNTANLATFTSASAKDSSEAVYQIYQNPSINTDFKKPDAVKAVPAAAKETDTTTTKQQTKTPA